MNNRLLRGIPLALALAALAACSERQDAPMAPEEDGLAENTATVISAARWAQLLDETKQRGTPPMAANLLQRGLGPLAAPGPAVCANGSTSDCNPEGSTLNGAAAFVDPSPPAGFTQCAGFINTTADDVRWDWENNCIPFKNNPLFVRVFDDASGSVLGGARLHSGVPLIWVPSTGLNYSTDSYEGEGLVNNVPVSGGLPGGVSLAWYPFDGFFCGCGRPPGGSGNCNDIFAANAANNKILYVAGNSSNLNYEAVWGPPGPKNTCSLSGENVRIRVAIYAGGLNQPPTADAGADQTVECAGDATSVTLDGSGSSDPDGDALTYAWSWTGGSASGVSPTISLADGTHTITLTVDDGKGGTDTDEVVVTIEDTTAPTLSFALLTTELWPPNHTMHTVATVSASDICDASASVAITVTSNEPDNGLGDGDTVGDWAIIDNGDGTYSVQVRAERGGTGTGRIYTITATATDDAGNASSSSGQVNVPYSKKK